MEQAEVLLEQRHLVTAREVDFTGSWRPRAILQTFQEVAEAHSEQLQVGFSTLQQKGLAWVLSRGTVELFREIVQGEEIRLVTWPAPERHGCYPRYTQLFDAEGNLVGNGVFLWMMMDLKERKMVSGEKVGIRFSSNGQRPAPLPLPKRMANKESPHWVRRLITPDYCDLDRNFHVNHTACLDWICQCLPLDFHKKYYLSRLDVNYQQELKGESEEQLSYLKEEEAGKTTAYLFVGEEGQPKLTLQTDWAQRRK